MISYVYNALLGKSNNKTLIGKLQNTITIYAHKNDKQLFNLSSHQLDKFPETPVLYTIEGQSSSSFIINTPTKAITCVLDNDVNVENNHCVVRQALCFTDKIYKTTLNHPVEFVLILSTDQTITSNGYFDADDTFHINTISNYDIVF
jgi:hypothetical protein